MQVTKPSALKEGESGLAHRSASPTYTLALGIFLEGLPFVGTPIATQGKYKMRAPYHRGINALWRRLRQRAMFHTLLLACDREGGCLVQLRPDRASGAACLNPKSAGDERVQYDDLVLCDRVTVCTK